MLSLCRPKKDHILTSATFGKVVILQNCVPMQASHKHSSFARPKLFHMMCSRPNEAIRVRDDRAVDGGNSLEYYLRLFRS